MEAKNNSTKAVVVNSEKNIRIHKKSGLKTLIFLFCALFVACGPPAVSKAKPGMSQQEVLDTVGKPDNVIPTPYKDTSGNLFQAQIWQYGANTGIVFRDGKVFEVLEDLDKKIRELKSQ